MKPIFIAFFVMALLAVGCSPRPLAVRKLDSIDPEVLVSAAHSLNSRALRKEQIYQYNIPEGDWPSIIRDLKPKIVQSTDYGTMILFFKWVSKEQGFYIPPAGYDPTKHDQSDNVKYEQIRPGIFWYSISG